MERVAIVGDGARHKHAPREVLDNLSVEIDVTGHSLLALRHGEGLHAGLKLLEHRQRAMHGLDVTMDLPPHLVGKKHVDLPGLYFFSKQSFHSIGLFGFYIHKSTNNLPTDQKENHKYLSLPIQYHGKTSSAHVRFPFHQQENVVSCRFSWVHLRNHAYYLCVTGNSNPTPLQEGLGRTTLHSPTAPMEREPLGAVPIADQRQY